MMKYDKEYIYDKEVAPLMSKIIMVCKDNDIPLIASFCYKAANDDEDFCTTFIPQGSGWAPESFKDCRKRLFNNSIKAFIITESKNGGE